MSNKREFKTGKTVTSLLAATDDLLDAVQQFSSRFTYKGNVFSVCEAVGKEGEISVAIPSGGTGEVVINLGKSLHNYPAQAKDCQSEFKRGQRVRVVELANQTLIVEEPAK